MEDGSPDEPLEAFYGATTDAGGGGGDRPRTEAGTTRWRTPVAGALMAGIAMGLRDVFEPEHRDRTAVEQPAPEQPVEPQRYEVHLDPIAPEASFAIYRPWVDDERADERPPGTDGGAGGRGQTGGAGALGG